MVGEILIITVKIMLNWWWLYIPAVLFLFLREVYLFWKNVKYYSSIEWVILEIRMPREVEKTPKAMEQVLNGLHGIHDPLNFKEKWIDGRILLWVSLEIVSRGGSVHFYIRAPKAFQRVVENNIYAQYPDAEIFEADDYTNDIPKEIPHKDYDMWGTDLILVKSDAYPIKTYEAFETEMTKEEKRIDPLASLLEHMSSMGDGEYLWFQILIRPFINERNWKADGEAVVAKIMGRKTPLKKKAYPRELGEGIYSVLIEGKPPEMSEEEKSEQVSIFRLTPGEQEVVKAIEHNISKIAFETNIRFIYIARNEVFSKAKGVGGTFGVLKQFASQNLNGFKPDITKTKVTYFFKKIRIKYLKRKLLRFYMGRFFPRHRKPYIFNTEELATLYHFPGKMAVPAPFVQRIEAKKGEPPPTLPI